VWAALRIEVLKMIETTVDYWTCLELAQALEQTMRNDLWSTADRIAETASRITNKPAELVAALQQHEIKKAALHVASELRDNSIKSVNLIQQVFLRRDNSSKRVVWHG
jgi:hypothetical protein